MFSYLKVTVYRHRKKRYTMKYIPLNMDICNLLCGIIILLLIIAGISYLLGADRLGEVALDIIRIIIVVVLIIILLALILYIIGYISWEGIPRISGTIVLNSFLEYKDLLTPFIF